MSKHIDADASDFQKGTGLTGPGEAEFLHNITAQDVKDKRWRMIRQNCHRCKIWRMMTMMRVKRRARNSTFSSRTTGQTRKCRRCGQAWALRLNDVYNIATEDMSGFDFAPDAFSPSTTQAVVVVVVVAQEV